MKKKILIVMANYYEQVSDGLLNSAKKRLPKPINLIKVPGVFEIPVIILKNMMHSLLLVVLLKEKHLILILFLKLR